MEKFENLVDEILKWGTEIRGETTSNLIVLEKQLVALYNFYCESQEMFEDKEYPDPPSFPAKEYMEIIQKNFPSIGYYRLVLDNQNLTGDNNNGVGDAIDDISDILRDLWDINWYLKNTSAANALFYFRLLFFTHTKGHIIGLLGCMNGLNIQSGK